MTLHTPLQRLRKTLIASAAILVVCLSSAACGSGTQGGGAPAGGGAPQMPPMPVKVAALTPTSVDDASEYVASVKSFASAVVKPQVDGNVTKINVHSGEHVKAGQPL